MWNNVKRLWFCGVPGSRLSGVSNFICRSVKGFNVEDRTEDRAFFHQDQKMDMFSGHHGHYYGQTEGTEQFRKLSDESPNWLIDQVDRLYQDQSTTKLLKSHVWARHENLDYIYENFPGDVIYLVYREPYKSVRWWHTVMKFDDDHWPDYRKIYDPETFEKDVIDESVYLTDFAIRHNLVWENVNGPSHERIFGKDNVTMDVKNNLIKHHDISVLAVTCGGKQL